MKHIYENIQGGQLIRPQVLFAIMSGVFGLAGWHFCKLSDTLSANLRMLTIASPLSYQCLVGTNCCQGFRQ
jgi:hypothetical protein